jgi:hypothetical protein
VGAAVHDPPVGEGAGGVRPSGFVLDVVHYEPVRGEWTRPLYEFVRWDGGRVGSPGGGGRRRRRGRSEKREVNILLLYISKSRFVVRATMENNVIIIWAHQSPGTSPEAFPRRVGHRPKGRRDGLGRRGVGKVAHRST